MPLPCDVTSVQRLLGFVNYSSRFLPRLSHICEPLRRLIDKGAPWMWTSKHTDAVEAIKTAVTDSPVLHYYDVNKEVTIECDSSEVGLGATLLQDGQPVSFASRALTPTEQRYAQIEKECLAVVYACQKFNHYILGWNVVTIHSDHKPLETIFKKPLITAPKRLQRMLLQLQKYNLFVIYKPGKRMYIADMPSRAALSQKQDILDNDNYILSAELASLNTLEDVRVSDASLKEIAEATRHDADLQQMIDYIRHGWPTSRKQRPHSLKHYWTFRDELVQDQGIIMKGPILLVSAVMRRKMLEKIHYSYVGADCCLRKGQDVLFWPGMVKAVHDYISKCAICNEFQPQQPNEPLIPHDTPKLPWADVAVALFTFDADNYVVAVDYF